VHQPSLPQELDITRWQPLPRSRLASQFGDGNRVAEGVGRLEVDETGDCRERGIQLIGGKLNRQRGFGRD